MQLIILPKAISEDLINIKFEEINAKELNEIVNELKQIDVDVEISTINLGRGNDLILLLATIGLIGNLIAHGDKLEKGIEGWAKIGKRIRKIFKRADKAYTDETGAKILALSYISEKFDVKEVKLINSHISLLADLSTGNGSNLQFKPFSIYIFNFEVNNEITLILSVKSNGEIIEILNLKNAYFDLPF